MKKGMRRAIKLAFEPPKPQKKQEFINNLTMPKTSLWQFVLSQIGYIRKRVWITEIFVVACCFFALCLIQVQNNLTTPISIISSIVPLVALIMTTEISCSISYNMAEIEMTTRYNLSQVMMTRMTILGITNLVSFLLITLLLSYRIDSGFLRLGFYIFVPYLLTCCGSLFALNKIRSANANFYCGGISFAVSVLNLFIGNLPLSYSDRYVFLWAIVFCILIVGIVFQINVLIKKTEELQWNSRLTG